MTNAANRKDIRAAEKEAKLIEDQNRGVVVELMSTTNGRAWIWRKLELAHMFDDPFTGDPYGEAYRKGERNAGLALLAEIMSFCPDQFILAMREANVRSTVSEQRRSKNFDGGDQGRIDYGDGDDSVIYNA